MQNPINLSPITQFAQIVRAAELSQSKEVKIPIHQARLINLSLIELMDQLHRDYESMYNALKGHVQQEEVEIQLDGGGFEEPK
jgi:alpha-mannosidase